MQRGTQRREAVGHPSPIFVSFPAQYCNEHVPHDGPNGGGHIMPLGIDNPASCPSAGAQSAAAETTEDGGQMYPRYYATVHGAGERRIVLIAKARCPWERHRDPVIESRCVSRNESLRALREMQTECKRMNGG